MNKRIAIFAPEIKDREEIGLVVDNYFQKEFASYFDNLDIQKFYALSEPVTENQIGHRHEVLVVFDRRLCPNKDRSKLTKGTPYFRALQNALELTKKVCDIKNIPYVIYRGEIAKKQEYLFVMEINNLKGKIRDRLEGLITSD